MRMVVPKIGRPLGYAWHRWPGFPRTELKQGLNANPSPGAGHDSRAWGVRQGKQAEQVKGGAF